MPKNKTYLGDGVYAKFDGFAIEVTAVNGVSVQHQIFLEPTVLQALVNFARQHNIAIK